MRLAVLGEKNHTWQQLVKRALSFGYKVNVFDQSSHKKQSVNRALKGAHAAVYVSGSGNDHESLLEHIEDITRNVGIKRFVAFCSNIGTEAHKKLETALKNSSIDWTILTHSGEGTAESDAELAKKILGELTEVANIRSTLQIKI